jgi:hypothetical protein
MDILLVVYQSSQVMILYYGFVQFALGYDSLWREGLAHQSGSGRQCFPAKQLREDPLTGGEDV